MKDLDERQFELGCGQEEDGFGTTASTERRDEALMRDIDKITRDTIRNVRPYLNRLVRDVESLLEGDFIRIPSSSVLDDMIDGLEKEIRKFVHEVRALKRWSRPRSPDSSSNGLH